MMPLFTSSGSLLFCQNTLASSCCPYGENGRWKVGDDDDEHDDGWSDDCELPEDYDGGFTLSTTCGTGSCDDCGPPLVEITVNNGVCSYSTAVLKKWVLARVVAREFSMPFDSHGTFNVMVGANQMSVPITTNANTLQDLTINIPSPYWNVFTAEGPVYIKTRIRLLFPDGYYRNRDETTIVWCEEWRGEGRAGEVIAVPIPIVMAPPLIDFVPLEQCGERWCLVLRALKGSYATRARAEEVLSDYYDALSDYAKSCVCNCACKDSEESRSGDHQASAFQYGTVVGGAPACTTVYAVARVWVENGTGYIFLYTYAGGTWQETVLASGEEAAWEGTIPPCSSIYFGGEAEASGVDEEFLQRTCDVLPDSACTEEITDAYEAVPIS